jgi:hypothetical protein
MAAAIDTPIQKKSRFHILAEFLLLPFFFSSKLPAFWTVPPKIRASFPPSDPVPHANVSGTVLTDTPRNVL